MKYRLALTILVILGLTGARLLASAPREILAQALEPPSVLGELEDVIWSADGKTVGLAGRTLKTALFDVSGPQAPEFIETITGYKPQLSPQGAQMLTTTYNMN